LSSKTFKNLVVKPRTVAKLKRKPVFRENGKKLVKTFQIFFKGWGEPYEKWAQLVPSTEQVSKKSSSGLRASCSRLVCVIFRFIFMENVKSSGVVAYQFFNWDSVGN